MAEEFSSSDQFYTKPPDWSNENVNNVITRDPNAKQIGVTQVYNQRCIEHEKFAQKSLPTLKSYGSIYDTRPLLSESDPLLGKSTYQRCHYLCADPIHLTRYRRTQIFLFFYIVFYVSYLVVGSICFQKLENGIEQQVRDEFRVDRQKFLDDYPNVKG